MLEIVVAGLWLGFVFNVAPGAVFTESLRRGVVGGFRPALAVQIGSLVGDAVWAVLGLAGAAAILTQPILAVPLTLIGCAILFLLGVSGIRSAFRPARPPQTAVASQRNALAAGAAMSLGNVWNVVYWGGAGGAVAGSLGADAPLASTVTFFLAFMLSSVLWCFICAALIAALRRALSPRLVRIVELVSSTALIVMAVVLAIGVITRA